jgi:hypothetical protein
MTKSGMPLWARQSLDWAELRHCGGSFWLKPVLLMGLDCKHRVNALGSPS